MVPLAGVIRPYLVCRPIFSQPMNFALLTYRTRNIGDEIQSLAARQYLPRVDCLVDREHLNDFAAAVPAKIILNGWFAHRPENWPPAPGLLPLFVSFHLSDEVLPMNVSGLRAAQHLLQGEPLAYLRAHAPIGCRDEATVERLIAAGVPAYFSGCLTLTLPDPCPGAPREDIVCCVDVSPAVRQHVAAQTDARLVTLSHAIDPDAPAAARFERAEAVLATYARSRLVVTSLLHCALPCLAFGTPVLFVDAVKDRYRISGLLNLLNHATEADVLRGAAAIDWRDPAANPVDISRLASDLRQRCQTFAASQPRDP